MSAPYCYLVQGCSEPYSSNPWVKTFLDAHANADRSPPDASSAIYAGVDYPMFQALVVAIQKARKDMAAISDALTQGMVDIPTGQLGFNSDHVGQAPHGVCAVINGAKPDLHLRVAGPADHLRPVARQLAILRCGAGRHRHLQSLRGSRIHHESRAAVLDHV